MKSCLRPAKRQRKVRMRAAVQHTMGMIAKGRMATVVLRVKISVVD
jgi:hypothetical protein